MILRFKTVSFFLIALSSLAAQAQDSPPQQNEHDFSEIRFGILTHDLKFPLQKSHERGLTLNGEYLFPSPSNSFFKGLFSPHPHIGLSLNSGTGTSMVYLGFTWEIPFATHWFVDIIAGGALHNGHTKAETKKRKNYGCRFLFHEGLALGYLFQGGHTLSVMVDHVSNASLYKPNPGFTDFGLRYGYRF